MQLNEDDVRLLDKVKDRRSRSGASISLSARDFDALIALIERAASEPGPTLGDTYPDPDPDPDAIPVP